MIGFLKPISIIISIFIQLIFFNLISHAHTKSDVQLYTVSNSPRVIGLGECSINLIDEQSVFDNPGTLGILHLDKLAAFSFPMGIDFMPGISDTSSRKTSSISGGINYRFLFGNKKKYNFSVAFAYTKDFTEMIFDVFTYNPYNSILNGDYFRREELEYYTISIAFEYIARFGFGYTMKSHGRLDRRYDQRQNILTQEYNYNMGHDIGIYLDMPFKLLKFGDDENDNPLKLMINPSFAYAGKNIGKPSLSDNESTKYIGFGLLTKLESNTLKYASLAGYFEYDRPGDDVTFYQVTYPNGWGYETHISKFEIRHKFGFELGLFETGYIRLGKIEDIDKMTYGFGISARGILKFITHKKNNERSSSLLWRLLDRFDIKYDFARTRNVVDEPVTYHKISLSL